MPSIDGCAKCCYGSVEFWFSVVVYGNGCVECGDGLVGCWLGYVLCPKGNALLCAGKLDVVVAYADV